MIESWNAKLNNGSKVGLIIMDLSKVSDSLNHNFYWQNWSKLYEKLPDKQTSMLPNE